jgi:hypothetical protein
MLSNHRFWHVIRWSLAFTDRFIDVENRIPGKPARRYFRRMPSAVVDPDYALTRLANVACAH